MADHDPNPAADVGDDRDPEAGGEPGPGAGDGTDPAPATGTAPWPAPSPEDRGPPDADAEPESARDPGDPVDDGLEFVDDLGAEDGLALSPRRGRWPMRIAYGVLLTAVAALVVYLVLIILYPERFGSGSWIGAKAPQAEDAGGGRHFAGFSLGGVFMGMAPDDVLRLYPDLRIEPGAEGGLVGSFAHHDGRYHVWFRALEYGTAAYRVRSQHVYAEKISYLALLSELAERYGKPERSTCGAEPADAAIGCALQWTVGDVRLEAQIRTAAPGGASDARTTLAVTAADTRPPVPVGGPAKVPWKN